MGAGSRPREPRTSRTNEAIDCRVAGSSEVAARCATPVPRSIVLGRKTTTNARRPEAESLVFYGEVALPSIKSDSLAVNDEVVLPGRGVQAEKERTAQSSPEDKHHGR